MRRFPSFPALGLGVLLWSAFPASVAAQDAAPRIDPAHEQAVLELFEVMDLEAVNRAALKQMIGETSMAGTPIADVMQRFFDRYMRWETLRPELVRIYAEALTESDLRALIAFYRSPLGQKLVASTPTINRRTMEVVSRMMAEHQAEFQAMLMDALNGGSR